MICVICSKRFRTPGRFRDHAVQVHSAARATVERAMAQSVGGQMALCPTANGRVMILIQPPLP